MIDVFCDLIFEFFDRTKCSIISDNVHDVDMNIFSVNITIKINNMHFEMSFFWLI